MKVPAVLCHRSVRSYNFALMSGNWRFYYQNCENYKMKL